MTSIRTRTARVFALLLAASAGAQTINVTLDGAQEVPPSGSTATGAATVTIIPSSGAVTVSGTYTSLLTAATAAHIHGPAGRGVNAGVIVPLTVSGGTTGTFSGGGTLTAAQLNDLCNSLCYLNVHTTGIATGEIRGQIEIDAGELPSTAQTPLGTGPLLRIDGNISSTTDRDLFWVNITNVAAFVATTSATVPVTGGDTQLFLFDAHGKGVTTNDDDVLGGSTITGLNFGMRGPGCYLLAITRYNCDPTSCGGLIWNNTPFGTERAPDGPAATGTMNGWTGTGGTGRYTINLIGCAYVATSFAEIGDAADLPRFAQSPCKSGKLTAISGNLGANDVDMYRIRIDDPAAFLAETCGSTGGNDSMLWLFTEAGIGVVANDDACVFESRINGALVPTSGVYLLAVSEFIRRPSSSTGFIWTSYNNVAPNGPGAASPVTSWTGATTTSFAYTIRLFGCSYASAATSTNYGTGSGSGPGVPTLSSPWPPQLGASVSLTLVNPDPTASAGALVLALARASIPFLGATILIDQHIGFVNFTPVSGNNPLPALPIPVNDHLCGQKVTFQVLLLVTPTGPFPNGFTLTNGVEWMFGL